MKTITLLIFIFFSTINLFSMPVIEKLYQVDAAPIHDYIQIDDVLFANGGFFRWNINDESWESLDIELLVTGANEFGISKFDDGFRNWLFDTESGSVKYSDDFGDTWTNFSGFEDVFENEDIDIELYFIANGSMFVNFNISENFTNYDLVYMTEDGENFEEIISHNGSYTGAKLGSDGTIYLIGENILRKDPIDGFVHWNMDHFVYKFATVPGYVLTMDDLNKFRLYDIEADSWRQLSNIPDFDYNYESVNFLTGLENGKFIFSTEHYFEPTSKLFTIDINSNSISLVNDSFPYLIFCVHQDNQGFYHLGSAIGDFVSTNPSEKFINNSKGLNVMPLLAFTISDDETAYVTTFTGNIFKLDKSGNQTDITSPDFTISSMFPFKDLIELDDGSLLLFMSNGIFKSSDEGTTWVNVHAQSNFNNGKTKFEFDIDGKIMVTAGDKILVSDDNGTTWDVTLPSFESYMLSLGHWNNELYVGTVNGLMKFEQPEEPEILVFEGFGVIDFEFTEQTIHAFLIDLETNALYGATANLDGELINNIKFELEDPNSRNVLVDYIITKSGRLHLAYINKAYTLDPNSNEWTDFEAENILPTHFKEEGNSLLVSTLDGSIYLIDIWVSVKNQIEYQTNLAYPNPANDHITLSLDQEFLNDVNITVYDSIGKLVMSEILSPSNNEIQLQTNELLNGTYQYIIRSGTNYSIGKFIISR